MVLYDDQGLYMYMLEMLDFTIHIGRTPTFSDLDLNTAYAAVTMFISYVTLYLPGMLLS